MSWALQDYKRRAATLEKRASVPISRLSARLLRDNGEDGLHRNEGDTKERSARSQIRRRDGCKGMPGCRAAGDIAAAGQMGCTRDAQLAIAYFQVYLLVVLGRTPRAVPVVC